MSGSLTFVLLLEGSVAHEHQSRLERGQPRHAVSRAKRKKSPKKVSMKSIVNLDSPPVVNVEQPVKDQIHGKGNVDARHVRDAPDLPDLLVRRILPAVLLRPRRGSRKMHTLETEAKAGGDFYDSHEPFAPPETFGSIQTRGRRSVEGTAADHGVVRGNLGHGDGFFRSLRLQRRRRRRGQRWKILSVLHVRDGVEADSEVLQGDAVHWRKEWLGN